MILEARMQQTTLPCMGVCMVKLFALTIMIVKPKEYIEDKTPLDIYIVIEALQETSEN